jgi:hypothetical protein
VETVGPLSVSVLLSVAIDWMRLNGGGTEGLGSLRIAVRAAWASVANEPKAFGIGPPILLVRKPMMSGSGVILRQSPA